MTTRAAVCAQAREWLGTPYLHQGHLRGAGCDCGGLIGGVGISLGLAPADFWEHAFAPHAGYARQPAGDGLVRVLDSFMARLEPAQAGAGDVVVMAFRREPQHVGFLVPYAHGGLAIVHALNGKGVVEHRLDDRWHGRVTHAYRLPGVA